MTRLNILSYCDNNKNLFEISKILKLKLNILLEEIKLLEKNGLISLEFLN